jgi:hypothetical protein
MIRRWPLSSGGATWSVVEAHLVSAGLRNQVTLLTDLLAENGTGLLITLDEIHRNQIGELRELATTVQHAFREEREVAFVGAGLASAVSDVANDEVLTFLRRAGNRSRRTGVGSPMTCSPRWSRELADTHSSSSWSGRGYGAITHRNLRSRWKTPASGSRTRSDGSAL